MSSNGKNIFLRLFFKLRHRSWFAVLFYSVIFIIGTEVLFAKVLLTKLPLNMTWFIDAPVSFLSLASCKKSLPGNYIAICGDSYARGLGDGFIQAHYDNTRPVLFGDMLCAATGRDCVSFGLIGAGTSEAVWNLYAGICGLADTLLYRISDPEMIIVFFYAGNDLSDNFMSYSLGSLSVEAYKSAGNIFERNAFSRFNLWAFGTLFNAWSDGFNSDLELEDAGRPLQPSENIIKLGGKKMRVPVLEGPALELDREQIGIALRSFEHPLKLLRQNYQKAKIVVVYIPSVLECYDVLSPEVDVAARDLNTRWGDCVIRVNAGMIGQNSDYIAHAVGTISGQLGVDFIDTRSVFKKVCLGKLLHGPKDWQHFNTQGYRVLFEVVLKFLNENVPGVNTQAAD